MAQERVSQDVLETYAKGSPNARASQDVIETAAKGTPNARVSQNIIEVLALPVTLPETRVSQLCLETLITDYEVLVPPVYPINLPGLDIKVVWRAKAFVVGPQIHTSGREFIIGASQYPMHEFDLIYNVLRNRPTETEFKSLLGFYLMVNGSLGGFLFKNPWDNTVKGQSFVTTDGINHLFGPIIRTFGASGNTSNEPVGYVDTTQPFQLYVDGAPVSATDATWGYTLVQTQPGNQQIQFTGTPSAGHVLTLDMSYFYYCRFSDDHLDFEQVVFNVFQVQKVTLVSKRG